MSSSRRRRLKLSPGLVASSRVTTQSLVLPLIGWPLALVGEPSLSTNWISMPATVPSRTVSCTTPWGVTLEGPVTRAREKPWSLYHFCRSWRRPCRVLRLRVLP